MRNRHLKIVWSFTFTAIMLLLIVQAFLIRKEYLYQIGRQVDKIGDMVDSCKMELRTLTYNGLKQRMIGEDKFIPDSIRVERTDTLFLESLSMFIDSMRQKEVDVKLLALSDEQDLSFQFRSVAQMKNMIVLKPTRIDLKGVDVARSDIISAVEDWSVYSKIPFDLSVFSSLLEQRGYQLSFIDTLTTKKFLWKSQTALNGRGLKKYIHILTPYNAIEKQCVSLKIPIKVAETLEFMWKIILLALLLSILLLGAMFIQVKTILRQQRINMLKTNFTGTMIHELKRPVQALQTIVSVVEGEEDQNARLLILNAARKELDNLSVYLQKLRDVNKEEQVVAALNFSWYNFFESLQAVIEQFKQKEKKPIVVSLKCSEHVMIIADKLALEGVMTNILENSIKFCAKETVQLKIDVVFSNSELKVSVQDNGIGISTSDLTRVTQPFFRSMNPIVGTLPGIGLGLSYVKMIVEAHGGKLMLSSSDSGTIVTFKIPQQQ